MSSFPALQKQLAPCRMFLGRHPLYRQLHSVDNVRTFMQYHVFAVWDFMCLVKTLQRHLTCTDSLWLPSKRPNAARFINEIVLDEESDAMADGSFQSHFEWYLEAMAEIGASRAEIMVFLDRLEKFDRQPRAAMDTICCPQVQAFVRNTIEVTQKPLAVVVGAFVFGREILIPQMFDQILQVVPDDCVMLQDYLSRHADIDENHHGP